MLCTAIQFLIKCGSLVNVYDSMMVDWELKLQFQTVTAHGQEWSFMGQFSLLVETCRMLRLSATEQIKYLGSVLVQYI